MHEVVLLFVLEHARFQREIARLDQHLYHALVLDVLVVVKSIADGLLALVDGHVNVVDHEHTRKFPVVAQLRMAKKIFRETRAIKIECSSNNYRSRSGRINQASDQASITEIGIVVPLTS